MRSRATDPGTVLVTGGSRGIGLALAREFARNGHDLVLVAREEEALQRAASRLECETGVRVETPPRSVFLHIPTNRYLVAGRG